MPPPPPSVSPLVLCLSTDAETLPGAAESVDIHLLCFSLPGGLSLVFEYRSLWWGQHPTWVTRSAPSL